MIVKVEEWHAVATWTWGAEDDACGICRYFYRMQSIQIMRLSDVQLYRLPFDGCCPDCKMPGDDCPIGQSLCSTVVMKRSRTYNTIRLNFRLSLRTILFV